MTGYERDDVLGKTPRILQGPDSDRSELDRLRKALEAWQPCELEIINYKRMEKGSGQIFLLFL